MNRFRLKMAAGQPLRVLFLNDVGFQFGAGIATMRQVQSFVRRGDIVMGLCCAEGEYTRFLDLNHPGSSGEWLGFHTLNELLPDKCTLPETAIGGRIFMAAAGSYPDLIIIGNIHNARWPVSFIPKLRQLGAEVITFLHDCYFVTGRCAYVAGCRKYLTGCDHTCPTPGEYPSLAPELIQDAWQQRRPIFGRPHQIPMVANSRWTQRFAAQAIPDAKVGLVHYGIDTRVYCRRNKLEARRELGLPLDQLIVLGGAVNLKDERKGGAYLAQLFQRLGPAVQKVVFGANSHSIPDARAFELLFSQRKVKLLYRAADIFVNTSTEEAFGQMMLEAAACELPIVAFDAGGATDIARHGTNALVVPPGDVEQLFQAVQFFITDPRARQEFGAAGRQIAVTDFSLERQAQAWTTYLKGLAATNEVPVAPAPTALARI